MLYFPCQNDLHVIEPCMSQKKCLFPLVRSSRYFVSRMKKFPFSSSSCKSTNYSLIHHHHLSKVLKSSTGTWIIRAQMPTPWCSNQEAKYRNLNNQTNAVEGWKVKLKVLFYLMKLSNCFIKYILIFTPSQN